MQCICRDFVLSFAGFEGNKICCEMTNLLLPLPQLPASIPQSANEHNSYFAPCQGVGNTETV